MFLAAGREVLPPLPVLTVHPPTHPPGAPSAPLLTVHPPTHPPGVLPPLLTVHPVPPPTRCVWPLDLLWEEAQLQWP